MKRALLLFVLFVSAVAAQTEPAAEKKEKPTPPEERTVSTTHTVTIGGREIAYTATAGTIVLKKEDGTARASVFFVAYTRDGVDDLTKRPITFTFNGGPGSSSVWLHMGAFGPRRVKMGPEGAAPKPPFELVNNEYSLLDLTDLVFIDPVTTGYSRAAEGTEPTEFHGVDQDIESVGDFIRVYATRNKRWASPKLLAGESYGTTRAAGLSGHLQSRYGMYLNGIVLVSSILNFQTVRFDKGNDLPYVLFLPTYTATAWYHQRLPADLQSKSLAEVTAEARRFASGDYTLALMQGDSLDDATRNRIAQQLSRLTGLDRDYIHRTRLRIGIRRFAKELLRDQGRTIGRFDSRLTGIDADDAGEEFDFDPSYAVIQGVYSSMLNHYIHAELNFESDLPYEILTGRVRPWAYGDYQNRYVNVAETLREAMTQNPNLKVIIANGYFDMATPFFATEYTVNHLGLHPSLRGNVSLRYYESGHMMYIREADLAQLRRDIAGFLAGL
ncbi:MAG: peptidase S10 [bacterium]|nr:peptidase S10 [bacterium]